MPTPGGGGWASAGGTSAGEMSRQLTETSERERGDVMMMMVMMEMTVMMLMMMTVAIILRKPKGK